jgi:hypothetical protein
MHRPHFPAKYKHTMHAVYIVFQLPQAITSKTSFHEMIRCSIKHKKIELWTIVYFFLAVRRDTQYPIFYSRMRGGQETGLTLLSLAVTVRFVHTVCRYVLLCFLQQTIISLCVMVQLIHLFVIKH